MKILDLVEEGLVLELKSTPSKCSYNKNNCTDFNSQQQEQQSFEQCKLIY